MLFTQVPCQPLTDGKISHLPSASACSGDPSVHSRIVLVRSAAATLRRSLCGRPQGGRVRVNRLGERQGALPLSPARAARQTDRADGRLQDVAAQVLILRQTAQVLIDVV